MVRARGRARLAERLLGQPLVLGLDVHRGEDTVAHAAEQPQARDSRAGADLDHRAGVEHGGEETSARARADGGDPDLLGAGTGGGEDVVLGDERLGVGPARGLDGRGDGGLLGRTRTAAGPRVRRVRRLYRAARAGHPAARGGAPRGRPAGTGPRSSVDEEYSAIPSKAGGRLTGGPLDRPRLRKASTVQAPHHPAGGSRTTPPTPRRQPAPCPPGTRSSSSTPTASSGSPTA